MHVRMTNHASKHTWQKNAPRRPAHTPKNAPQPDKKKKFQKPAFSTGESRMPPKPLHRTKLDGDSEFMQNWRVQAENATFRPSPVPQPVAHRGVCAIPFLRIYEI